MLKFQKVVNLVRVPLGSLCKAVCINLCCASSLNLSLVHLLTVHAFHNCLQTQAEFSNDRNQIISFFQTLMHSWAAFLSPQVVEFILIRHFFICCQPSMESEKFKMRD